MDSLRLLLCTTYLQCALWILTLLAFEALLPALFEMMMAHPYLPITSMLGIGWSEDSYRGTTAFFTTSAALLLLSILAYIALLTLCFATLAKEYKNNNVDALLQKMKRVKFGLAPFWAINAALLASLIIGNGFLDSMAFKHEAWRYLSISSDIVKHFFFAVIGLLYIHLILTSRFSLAYLKRLRKNGVISKRSFAAHSVLQLLFIADIFDTVALVKKHGEIKPLGR